MTESTRKSEPTPSSSPSVQTLIAQLHDSDGQARGQARFALAKIGKPAVAPLLEVCSASDHHGRWEACKTLSMIGDPATAPAFVKALEDDAFEIRWLAAEGLIAIGRKRSEYLTGLLHALLRHPTSARLREGAYHVFHGLVLTSDRKGFQPLVEALSSFDWNVNAPAAVHEILNKLESKVSP